MRYVIDIDGTICHHKNPGSCYKDGTPIKKRINALNKLYDKGHHVTYFTARGMGRHSNNAKLAEEEFRELTEYQLKQWKCKYHELFLGKPAGDIYIDDKGIKDEEFFRD
tara:strand:+ start:12017 stop:12343 length:327 start_codon:yes stop_codon:yes gene_type:complete